MSWVASECPRKLAKSNLILKTSRSPRVTVVFQMSEAENPPLSSGLDRIHRSMGLLLTIRKLFAAADATLDRNSGYLGS